MEDVVRKALTRLIEKGFAKAGEIHGCSPAEISQIAALANGALPASYRSFLQNMGRGAGSFLRGTDIFYPEVLRLRGLAEGLVRERPIPWTLTDREFVFSSHQGYQFLFFDCSKGDDPPVMYFLEGEEGPQQVSETFSEWLTRTVQDELVE